MQQLFNNYILTEADLIERALARPLGMKVDQSVNLIKLYVRQAEKTEEGRLYLCNSFGKDSIVCKALLKRAGVPFSDNHNFTTIDPPELIRYGKEHHRETIIHRSKHGHLILDRMVEKGFPPSRIVRWCCDEYKEGGGSGCVKVIGVRASESKRRALLWKEVQQNRDTRGLIIAPIVYWTDKDIWEFIHNEGIPYCSLYDEGFKRLGCIGCPLAGKAGQKREFERWPKYKELWRLGFHKMWEACKGRFSKRDGGEWWFYKWHNSADDLFNWWLSGGAFKGPSKQCVFEEMAMQR